jgi:hypothetical protein
MAIIYFKALEDKCGIALGYLLLKVIEIHSEQITK